MSLFGTPAIPAVSGVNRPERIARDRARARPEGGVRPARDEDQLDLEVQNAEADDAVRGLSGNAREETSEDRQKQDGYRPQARKPDDERPRLDLSA
jgi:hypothetical protein